jgi:hypothetical protein
LRVVVAFRMSAIAAGDEKEVANLAALHCLTDLRCNAQNRMVAEAGEDGVVRSIF